MTNTKTTKNGGFLGRLLGKSAADNRPAASPAPAAPDGQCAYVIGDIHGCLPEMLDLLNVIAKDIQNTDAQQAYIVFLGDLIDRGPDSSRVVELLRRFRPDTAQPIFLTGNHEEIFLKVLEGRYELLESWFSFGGRDCARSYGVENLGAVYTQPEFIMEELQKKVPTEHVQFLKSFQDSWRFGDYYCAHAGIRPKIPLENQKPQDLRWIRDSFLKYKKPHPAVIVHGHTIVESPEDLQNRIAVDTGAYKTGVLSCVKLHQHSRIFISTQPENTA